MRIAPLVPALLLSAVAACQAYDRNVYNRDIDADAGTDAVLATDRADIVVSDAAHDATDIVRRDARDAMGADAPADANDGSATDVTDVQVDSACPGCAPPAICCGTTCLQASSDPSNCGGCGIVCGHTNTTGSMCVAGHCMLTCISGYADCDGDPSNGCEGNLSGDPANCQTCAHNCSPLLCNNGACACLTGLTNCGGNCVYLPNDPANCGACGTTCDAGTLCGGSACTATCPGSTIPCGTSCVDPVTNRLNCGACGNACAADETCSAGTCTPCPAPNTVCINRCTNLMTSTLDCGSCNNNCPTSANCVNGTCECAPGDVVCNGSCVSLLSNRQNCGACGMRCMGGLACVNGHCG